MVDFANANLCGASPELNDVLSKLEDAKADITAKLDASASAASAAFGEAKNELEGLKNKLQTIEIPAIPKLNLQAEIASLTSLVPGTPSFLSALAKVKLEFEDDIKGAGLDLGTLVADATTAITGGGDLCALVPNLEKASGSLDAATTKPAAVTQAAAKAISEAPSVVRQNVAVETKVTENKQKTESYTVTNTPPTEDKGSFVIAKETKKISVKETVSEVTTQSKNSNVAASNSAGFARKPERKTEYRTIDQLEISGNSITIKNLKHKPVSIIYVAVHPPTSYDGLVMPKDDLLKLGRTIETDEELGRVFSVWEREGEPPYYISGLGPHLSDIIRKEQYGALDAVGNKLPVKIDEDGNVTIEESEIIPEKNHPGNITSVPTWKMPYPAPGVIKEFLARGIRPIPRWKKNGHSGAGDKYMNGKVAGYALLISYNYLDNYDADVKT